MTPRLAGGIAAATRTLPRDLSSFTGRDRELAWLIEEVSVAGGPGVAGIYAIGGMAGIGKTSFAVRAAHLLASGFPDGQVFLPLHGHTPGLSPVEPEEALASLLQTVGVAAEQVPHGLEARAGLWRDCLAGKRLLIVLDDALGHEQVRPLLPGAGASLVLITSRRHLAALDDVRSLSLDTLSPSEAASLLTRLSGRAALDDQDPSAEVIARLCGYLPLAVGMIARQLHHHPAWTPGGLAAELSAARDRLELMHAENLSVAAAFDLSYRDLSAGQQRLFRRLGLHPGDDIETWAAASLAGTDVAEARRDLAALYDQHLLSEHAPGRYRLHDLIREHARSRASEDAAPEPAQAIGRLLDYYAHAAAASRLIIRRPPAGERPVPGTPPQYAPDLPTREAAAAWMEAERLNLQAAAQHDVPHYAASIAASMHGFLRTRNYWDQALALHQNALAAARNTRDRAAEARALADLGDTLYLCVDYPHAASALTHARRLYHELGDRTGEASVLSTLGVVHDFAGDAAAATANQEQSLALYKEIGDPLGQATALNRLGWLTSAAGDYQAAAALQQEAFTLFRGAADPLGEANALASLGRTHLRTGDQSAATTELRESLDLFHSIGSRVGTANTLLAISTLHQDSGKHADAVGAALQALDLYREVGSRLGEVWALTKLAALHNEGGNGQAADQALTLAHELGKDLRHQPGQPEVR